MTRPVDTMTIDSETRVIAGSGTYMDGAEYFGPADFEAERGETFAAFCERMQTEPAPEGEPAAFFVGVRAAR